MITVCLIPTYLHAQTVADSTTLREHASVLFFFFCSFGFVLWWRWSVVVIGYDLCLIF